MDLDNEIQIGDMENYSGSGSEKFSHSTLVMSSIKKCIDSGNREMISGYWNVKTDRFGNVNRIWIPDARKVFIEAIKTLKNVLAADLDKDAEDEIKKIVDAMDERYNELCEYEKKEWEALSPLNKQQRVNHGMFNRPDSLNKGLEFYEQFIEDQVDYYREIFEQLQHLINRREYFKSDEWSA